MLLSFISLNAFSGSAISVATTPGLPQYGASVVFGLIAFISLEEVLSVSEKWNNSLKTSLDLAILPLLSIFVGTILFKVAEFI